jgi:hypothetical protein
VAIRRRTPTPVNVSMSLVRLSSAGSTSEINGEATIFASYRVFSVGRKLQLRAVALILALLR